MQPKYCLNGETYIAEPVRHGDETTLEIDGHQVTVRMESLDQHRSELVVDGVAHRVCVAQDGDKLFIHMDGKTWQVDAVNEFSAIDGEGDADSGVVRAPMPGVVLEVNVVPGDEVETGQCLLLIESMKLQTEVKAPVAGTVSKISFEAGQPFEKASVLVEIALVKSDMEQGGAS